MLTPFHSVECTSLRINERKQRTKPSLGKGKDGKMQKPKARARTKGELADEGLGAEVLQTVLLVLTKF